MAKYDPLRDFLAQHRGSNVTMSFDEVAELVGGLPKSAFDYREWWANEVGGNHVQAKAWMGADYAVYTVDLRRESVQFLRV